MKLELTEEELKLLQKLIYNESLKQNYLVRIETIAELPKELVSLTNKLKGDK